MEGLDKIKKSLDGKENYSSANGEEVTATNNLYLQVLGELNLIDVNIANKQVQIDDAKAFIASSPSGKDYDPQSPVEIKKRELIALEKAMTTLKANRSTKATQVNNYQSQYFAAKKRYEDAVANENRIAAEAKAEAANLDLQTKADAASLKYNEDAAAAQLRLDQQLAIANGEVPPPSPTPTTTEPMKASFMSGITKKQYMIAGAIAAVIIGVIMYKKGVFKMKKS